MGISKRRRRGRGIVAGTLLTMLAVQAYMSWGINGKKLYWADLEYGTTVRNLSERKAEFPNRPVVLVLGSSRSRAAFAADTLSEPVPGDAQTPLVLDACLSGAHPIHYLLMLRRLIAIGVKPSAVLIEILPAQLRAAASPGGSDPDRLDLSLNAKTEAHRLRPADLSLVRTYDGDHTGMWIRRMFESQAAPWYTHRYTLTSRYAESWAPKENITSLNNWKTAISPYGWNHIKLQSVPEQLGKDAEKVTETGYKSHLKFTEASTTFDRMLRELLGLCSAEKIDVLGLVLMPESTTFRSWYPDETKKFIRGYIDGVAAEYGTRRIDANTWIPDEYFLDGHHLIEPGALLFSARIRDEIIRPWLKGRER